MTDSGEVEPVIVAARECGNVVYALQNERFTIPPDRDRGRILFQRVHPDLPLLLSNLIQSIDKRDATAAYQTRHKLGTPFVVVLGRDAEKEEVQVE